MHPSVSPGAEWSAIDALRHSLALYAERWPDEVSAVGLFSELLEEAGQVSDESDPFTRRRYEGHFTASCWLVDRSSQRVLLTHHRKLQRWLQLGGHADGDSELPRVALREAEEESGLSGLQVEPEVFDLDRHWIPERGDVPGHWHYDVRFVIRAGEDEAFVVSEESLDLAWCSIAALAEDEHADASMRRMAGKWLSQLNARG